MTSGMDVACRAAHQASFADENGGFLWSGRRFRTSADELRSCGELARGDQVTVVIEPTRNAWVPLASWFRRKGATVVMVPSERSADLREYYSKHTKSDRLDSKLLARIPLLHPEGLYAHEHLGPAEPLRRATRLRSSLVKRRSEVICRIDALLEILGPEWHRAIGGRLTKRSLLRFPLLATPIPTVSPDRSGPPGSIPPPPFAWPFRRPGAARLLGAANETLGIWGDELDFGELADDIAVEARLALALTAEIKELEERIAVMYRAWTRRDLAIRPRRRCHQRCPDPRSARRPGSVSLSGRGPFLLRARALAGLIRAERQARWADQVR